MEMRRIKNLDNPRKKTVNKDSAKSLVESIMGHRRTPQAAVMYSRDVLANDASQEAIQFRLDEMNEMKIIAKSHRVPYNSRNVNLRMQARRSLFQRLPDETQQRYRASARALGPDQLSE